MQTIESLAERLDMTPEEAVEALRTLHFDIEGTYSVVTDEQCDMLIEGDEDPAALNRYLKDIQKKEEQARKRTERLQKAAAKKAADKRKAPSKPGHEGDDDAEIIEEGADTDSDAVILEAEILPPETAEEEGEDRAAESPLAEILPALPEEEAAAETDTANAGAAQKEEKPKTAKPRKRSEEEPGFAIGSAIDRAEEGVEVVRADGTLARAAELEIEEGAEPEAAEEEETASGVLAEAERRQEEEERRRAKQKAARPLPKPDPQVVADVIRKAQERTRRKEQRRTTDDVAPVAAVPAAPAAPAATAKSRKTGKTARKKQRRAERMRQEESMRREAAAAVKEFMAGGTPKRKKRKRSRETDDMGDMEMTELAVIEVEEMMTVEQLATAMDVQVSDIILELMEDNILATKNQTLELETIQRLAEKFGFEVKAIIPEEAELFAEEPDDPADLAPRAPVVTVMGHVDHGKTSFLDVVRSANVAEGEAGGITQHIAAYDVETANGRLVFLDTPGHEAFTQMRARGATVTDIVVLVVAADDGVRPQTIEAIDHAKAADVPIVVAINKIDKPNAEPDRVRQELIQYELVDEDWGGKTLMKNISAKMREGIDDLLELLALQADALDLKANPTKRARGAIVESEMSRHQGPVAWVLVQNGTLHVGDIFLAGTTTGRVRSLTTSQGKQVEVAGPSTPVLVTGFSEPPDAGDIFAVVADERTARAIADQRASIRKQKRGAAARHMTLEDFHARMLAGERKHLNIIVKADVQGSVDVLESSFTKLGNEEVSVNVVHAGVGGINESDVLLASASDAVILGFHVEANPKAEKLSEQEGVEIRTYRIIYEALDEVQKALEGMLTPETREVVVGHAEVRAVFSSSALGNIAGCYQIDGETTRNSLARLKRKDEVIFEGKIGSLRRNKDDVKSVLTGFECGIKLEGFDAIQEGDLIETYRLEQVAKTLS
ncbi:MAG: translation initiation factor IF-2 [Candidatus Hydrogenedentes bacterium]|nr:translation initiation factor IF-2 [Candidatus Hydrogenedentota bacterium]